MRLFEAKCTGGIVTVNTGQVVDCPVLGNGGDSEGYLVISDTQLVYMPLTAVDTESLIDILTSLSDTLKSLCDAIAQIQVIAPGGSGGITSTPQNASQITSLGQEIDGKKQQLDQLKEILK